MGTDVIDVLAGDCTVRYEGEETRDERGAVVVIAKPDNTVLVHDQDGYGPIAWLTRADALTWAPDTPGPFLEAVADGQRLNVTCHTEYGSGRYPTSRAGQYVGVCPDCAGPLIHGSRHVQCLGCEDEYTVPSDAVLVDAVCECGLPRMRVERGAAFTLCVDRGCEPLDDLVRDRFDREWPCPTCGGDLVVLRRGGLIAGCENYPECETGFSIPSGTTDGPCSECSLPTFETPSGQRCLDATCTGG